MIVQIVTALPADAESSPCAGCPVNALLAPESESVSLVEGSYAISSPDLPPQHNDTLSTLDGKDVFEEYSYHGRCQNGCRTEYYSRGSNGVYRCLAEHPSVCKYALHFDFNGYFCYHRDRAKLVTPCDGEMKTNQVVPTGEFPLP